MRWDSMRSRPARSTAEAVSSRGAVGPTAQKAMRATQRRRILQKPHAELESVHE